MSALPQPRVQQAANDTLDLPELRILSGCHAGARVPIDGPLRLGAGEDCDVILSDFDLPAGASIVLRAAAGRWSASPDGTAAEPDSPDSKPPDGEQAGSAAAAPELPLGKSASIGGIFLTVSAAHAPWQQAAPAPVSAAARPKATPAASLKAAAPAEPGQTPQDSRLPPATAAAAPAVASDTASAGRPGAAAKTATDATIKAATDTAANANAATQATSARSGAGRVALLVGLLLLALLLGALLILWLAQASAPQPAAATAAPPAIDSARQQQLLQDIRQALAGVDPALRLQVEPLPDGGARVSGWVADIEQLDRVAEALGRLRPLPTLGLRTAADLLDELGAAANASGAALGFEPLGAGRIRVSGALTTRQEQAQVLAQLRQHLPAGVELVDGLRVAQSHGPAVQDWLRQAGFDGAQAHWDADSAQLVVELPLAPQQRPALERLLASPGALLAGLPFTLQVRERAPEAVALQHASAAPLPFRIRGVVGGPAPYVVLGDGAKLQPGGRRSGWRLEQINPDTLVFDGPRRLTLLR